MSAKISFIVGVIITIVFVIFFGRYSTPRNKELNKKMLKTDTSLVSASFLTDTVKIKRLEVAYNTYFISDENEYDFRIETVVGSMAEKLRNLNKGIERRTLLEIQGKGLVLHNFIFKGKDYRLVEKIICNN